MWVVGIIVLVLLFLFIKVDDPEDTQKVGGDNAIEKGKMKSGRRVFKAAATDGTNNVLVSTDNGQIQQVSDVARIDARTVEMTGNLNVNGKVLKIGTWTLEDTGGELHIFKDAKNMDADKPIVRISQHDGNIWLNSSAGGRSAGWLAGELGGLKGNVDNLNANTVKLGQKIKMTAQMYSSRNGEVKGHPKRWISYIHDPETNNPALNMDPSPTGSDYVSYGVPIFQIEAS